jgi:purine-nucleoside phosphorylase
MRGASVWVFESRLHIYERVNALQAAYPVALLAAAGAQAVVLTCAAGGLLEDDTPGAFAIVTDHVNLLGDDPLRHIPVESREPAFLDLQHVYDSRSAGAWREAARRHGVALRDGVLAAMPGPCYETPAEVRLLRAIGADLASMSVVPEAILAAYRRLRVTAIACISNRGAGVLGLDAIDHGQVEDVVARAVSASASFFRDGLHAMLF